MDESSAYLDLMFGTAHGHVAVAYKGPRDSWHEQQFEWPEDRSKVLWWAKQHARGNLFICPALRTDAHTRKKGDGTNLHWLWADVDWDKVPADKHEVVRKRISQVGTYVVSSGTGDNAHVYVKLSRVVSVVDHFRLNTGLRDYLYADAKHADNSLLRLPGSTNWKTKPGTPVRKIAGHNKRISPDALIKLRAFARVKAIQGDTGMVDWVKVDVSDVPRRLVRMANMSPDEGLGRYGSRHKAVWAIVGDLHRAGLDDHTIHTLMDGCPLEVSKREDEHGAYDVHKDVARRLAAIVDAQRVVDTDGEDDSPFRDLTDEELAEFKDQSPANIAVNKELARREVKREADRIEAMRRFMAPPDDVSWTAAEMMANPPQRMKYLIGPMTEGERGIAGVKHNVVITAQYKTGKTALVLASLARALCDGESFLDAFETPAGGVVVGHWNCEMEGDELFEDYIACAGFENPDNLKIANLRGYGVNILTAEGKAWTVEWLRSRDVKVWTIDSLARLLRMCGVKEKENDEVLNVLMAVDEIKVEAGVDVCFVIAHTGRVQHEEGSERARGATVIDDWPDARWILTKEGAGPEAVRFLAVEGRGVSLRTTSLVFDGDTKRSVLGGESRTDVADDGNVQAVVEIVRATPGLSKLKLTEMVKRRLKSGIGVARDAIEESIENGWVEVRRETRSGGGRASIKHFPVGGENSKYSVSSEGTGATPRPINFRSSGRWNGRGKGVN